MIFLSAVFFLVSLVTGLLGFTGLSAGAAAVARLIFGICIVLFLASMVLAVILLL